MKVVIDTNVFVSSFLGGKPRRVIDHWRDGSVTLCCAQSILEEYFRVLETLDFVCGSELQELVGLFHEQYNLIYAA